MTRLRRVTADDAAAIAAIYAPFVADTAITFETEPLTAAMVAERVASGGDLYPWFVAEEEAIGVLGYAYASQFRPRHAYRFAVETTVYLDPAAFRRGIGTALYRLLLDSVTSQGFTQAIAAITLPNEASVALHEKAGFRHTGVYREVGFKLGAWHDVGLWQCRLGDSIADPPEPRPLSAVRERFD